MRGFGRWLALALFLGAASLPAAASAYGVPGTPVHVTGGGTFSAAELSALPGGRVLPLNVERDRDDQEGSRRNVEKPPPKKQNVHSPRAADGGVARDVAPAVSLASPLGIEGPNLNDAPFYPPDTQGDIGPTQFIAMINGRVRSYNKSTGAADGALDVDTDVFWSSVMTPPTSDNFTTDPHIRYDRLSGRWFAVMIDVPGQNATASNRIMLAVSDSGTITDATNFHVYEISEGVSGEFADYPTLGIDKNALYIGTNQFKTTGSGAYAGTNAYVVNKASLIAGSPTATRFRSVATATSSGPFTPQGVDNDDPNSTTGYFIGVDNRVFGQLDLLTIANPGGTPTLSSQTLTVPATAAPLSATVAGGVTIPGGTALDDLDDRLFAAQMQNGHIFTAHNIGVNASGVASASPTRDGSRWYEINPGASPTLVQSGTVFDTGSTNPLSYWIPSVAVSKQGLLAIGGTVAGAAHMPNAWYAARAPGEAAGTVGGLTEYTSTGSSTSYNPPFNRWGDYSLTRVDPNDGMTLWTIQEYIAADDVWGTRVAKLRAPAPPAPTGASAVTLGAASTPLTITGAATNGVGYFDPGTGFPNRLRVDITGCGMTINGVTSVAPASVALDVNTTAVSDGASCDVTITNPDGQAATTNALFTAHAPVANGQTFKTPSPPVVTTGSATAVGVESATLNATVDPGGSATTFVFQYGTSTAYGRSAPVPAASAGSASQPLAVTAAVKALKPGATIHFRVVATNGAGTTNGADSTFRTQRLRVSAAVRKSALRAALAHGLRARLRCNTRCTVKAELMLPAKVAKRMRLKRTAASGKVTAPVGGGRFATLRFTKKARGVLARQRSVMFALRLTATTKTGGRTIVTKSVKLKR